MNDFKRNDRFGGGKRAGGFGKKDFGGGRPSFGGKPAFQRSGGAGFNRPQLPMFPAVCVNCGKATEVPFRPDGQRPIYCRDCLGGNKTSGPASGPSFGSAREYPKRDFQKPAFHAPAPAQASKPDPRIDDIQSRLAKVLVKLDQILLEIAVAKAQAGAEAANEAAVAPKAPKKKPSKKK